MNEKLAIRLATASDVETIHKLLQHLADSTGLRRKLLSRTEDILRFGFGDQPRFEVLLAEQGEAVVGLCLFFYNFSSWRGELGVYIQDLVVHSDARAAGTGRSLVRETARHAVEQGATHLRLSVDRDNYKAKRFYEKIGLQESADESIFAAYEGDFVNLVEAV